MKNNVVRVLILTGLIILGFGCTSKPKVTVDTKAALNKTTQPPKYSGIVRLVNEQGRSYCSAVVIGPTAALTATHCVVSGGPMGYQVNADVFLQSNDNKYKVEGSVVSVATRQDVAVIRGDFSKFTPLKYSTDPASDILANNYTLTTCGYPYGGKLVCYSASKAFKAGDMVGFSEGQMYAGMSGGPVIDLPSGTVLGVNHAITLNAIFIAPLINTFTGQTILE